ncbi:MAG TPA: zinc-ribbon domain-containing protein, partial [Ktedonobacterales bacterium]|nr:zinc-ribbon domain-containing protein [Ktedonobacterales bacterium]
MICPRCGQPVPTDAIACPSCGLARPATTAQRCPVCGAPNATGTKFCPHCGTSLPSRPIRQQPAANDTPSNGPPYAPKAVEEQAGAPIVSYARSRYEQPPTIPILTAPPTPTSSAQRPSPDETATVLAMPQIPQEAESEIAWAQVPPLTTGEPDDIPFVITSAASAAATTKPATPGGDRPPDFDTPDAERPAIHTPKPPLPDFDTPDIERTAIRIPKPPLPDFDTPDVERPAIHTPKPPPPDTETPDTEHPAIHPVNANTAHRSLPATPSPAASSGPGSGRPTHDLVERIFGAQPSSKARTANTTIQRLWLRFLPPEWAVAPWVSIPIGALAALVVGLIVTTLGLPLWPRAISYLLDTSDAIGANANLIRAVLSPNLLQLFLLEHSIPMSLASGSPGTTGSFAALETLPLTGLSLIPACALVLAGYVAAASDFTHRLRFSMLRGALVGPVYGILLLLVAFFGYSTVPVGQNTVIQLHPSIGLAFLAGLLWGTLLGALGSLLAIR